MNKNITINGKEYQLKPIDFNAVCQLEELGFSVADLKNRTFNAIRSCFAFHSNLDLEKSGKELEAHLKNGGKQQDFATIIQVVIESDFFQNLSK